MGATYFDAVVRDPGSDAEDVRDSIAVHTGDKSSPHYFEKPSWITRNGIQSILGGLPRRLVSSIGTWHFKEDHGQQHFFASIPWYIGHECIQYKQYTTIDNRGLTTALD